MTTMPIKAFALAAFAAMSFAAHASGPGYTFSGGGAVLTFTSDSLAALNTAGVTVTGTAPASFDGAKINMTSSDAQVLWNANYDVTSLTGGGGFTLTSGTTKGAQVVLSNIRLDTTSATVFADMVSSSFSSSFGSYQGKSLANMALFTGNATGSTNILASGGNVSFSINNLKLSSVAVPELGNALGVPSFIQNALFPSINFGTIALNSQFAKVSSTPSVPEPSTYLLMGMGLIGLVHAKRRSTTR